MASVLSIAGIILAAIGLVILLWKPVALPGVEIPPEQAVRDALSEHKRRTTAFTLLLSSGWLLAVAGLLLLTGWTPLLWAAMFGLIAIGSGGMYQNGAR